MSGSGQSLKRWRSDITINGTAKKDLFMAMNDEITQAIQKNLPAAVAGELKSYLAQAEADKEQIVRLSDKVAQLRQACEIGDKALKDAQEKLAAHVAIDKRLAEVTEKENRLAVTLAEARASAAERRAEDIHALVGTVFKNPTVKRSLYENQGMNQQYNSQTGGTIAVPNGTTTITEETVED
jgi:hypothetical protein